MNNNRKEFFDLYSKRAISESTDINDPFIQDALEGWKEFGYKENAFKKLDAQFAPRFSFLFPSSILIFIGATIYFLSVNPKSNIIHKKTVKHVSTKSKSNKKVNSVPYSQKTNTRTILPKTKTTNSASQTFEEKMNEEIVFNYQALPLLPFRNIETKITSRKNLAKETYLNDYKVVDYRFYRKRSDEKTNDELLTGVPASFENEVENKTNETLALEKSYFNYLEKTLKLLKSGQHEMAIIRFQEILKTYELDVNALFYLAFSQYEMNNYQSSLETLERLNEARFTNFDDDANWFKLNCYVKLGKKSQFEDLKRKMLDTESGYSKLIQNIEF